MTMTLHEAAATAANDHSLLTERLQVYSRKARIAKTALMEGLRHSHTRLGDLERAYADARATREAMRELCQRAADDSGILQAALAQNTKPKPVNNNPPPRRKKKEESCRAVG